MATIVAAHGSPRLYLPDYICNAAATPARWAGARIAFYPVDEPGNSGHTSAKVCDGDRHEGDEGAASGVSSGKGTKLCAPSAGRKRNRTSPS